MHLDGLRRRCSAITDLVRFTRKYNQWFLTKSEVKKCKLVAVWTGYSFARKVEMLSTREEFSPCFMLVKNKALFQVNLIKRFAGLDLQETIKISVARIRWFIKGQLSGNLKTEIGDTIVVRVGAKNVLLRAEKYCYK